MENINELILFLKGKCDNHFLSVYEYTECLTFLEKLEKALSPSADSSEVSEMEESDLLQLRIEIEHIFESGANELRIYEMVKTFIERRYLRSKLKSQWVSVNKNLPVMYDEVLVIDYTGYVTFAKLGGDEERFYESRQEKEPYLDNITHWMHLPESPIK